MNETQMLARRRELVMLSARLQRSAICARFDRLQENKLPMLAALAMRWTRKPWARAAAFFALGRVLRRIFRKPDPSASKDESHS
jgi:hypothetical protein